MGVPAEGFSAMVYGLPKSGKSTFCLGFAHHLAAHHGNIRYCAVEEGFGYTLKEKIERLQVAHPRLFIAGQLPDTLEGFDFIFIDSVSKAGLDLDTLQEVREDYPSTSSILIYHTTKAGNFHGENVYTHEVDVIVQVAAGEITGNGRFASGGKVKMGEFVSY
jgi:KaiC/GvpD/RAD55 family RecA-like ATPase